MLIRRCRVGKALAQLRVGRARFASPIACRPSSAARAKTQPALGVKPRDCATDIRLERAFLKRSIAQAKRQRLDLLEPDPARVPPAGGRDATGENALDDRDRRLKQDPGVDGPVSRRASSRPRPSSGPALPPPPPRGGPDGRGASASRPSLARLAISARRRGRANRGSALDGSSANAAARARAKATSRALSDAQQRPRDRDAVAPAHRLHAAQARDPRPAHEAKQHRLRLIVGVMSSDQRVGADGPRVFRQQPVARLARPLLQPGRRLAPRPYEGVVWDAKPLAELSDASRLGRALRPQAMIDSRRDDPRRCRAAPPIRRPSAGARWNRGRRRRRRARIRAASRGASSASTSAAVRPRGAGGAQQ